MSLHHNPWKIISEKKIYHNPWIYVTEFDVLNPSGNKGIYGKVHFNNIAVGVIVLDENEDTFLVGQYRFPINRYSWEIPEGGAPINTDPLEECKRELLEETGIAAKQWQPILNLHLSNSVTDEESIIYLATDITHHSSSPEETEELVVKKLPFENVYKMVLNGEISDAMSVAAILKVKLMLLEANSK